MTHDKETEILCNVYNSIKNRSETRIKKWLPKVLHFHIDDRFVTITDVKVFERGERRPIKYDHKDKETYDKETYVMWRKSFIKEIIYMINPATVPVVGNEDSKHQHVRHVGDSMEYKANKAKGL